MELDLELPATRSAVADWTPLIDVVFQLLVFFMLTSNFIVPHLDLTLPTLKTESEPTPPQHLVLSIDAQGNYFVNGERCGREQIPARLRQAAETGDARQSVYLQADKQLPYSQVLEGIVAVRDAGLADVELMYEE